MRPMNVRLIPAAILLLGSPTYPATEKKRRNCARGGFRICLAVLAAMACLQCRPMAAQGVCPAPKPEGASSTLNVPLYRAGRPPVRGDYVVIEYNASQNANDPNRNQTSWTDYSRFFDPFGQSNRMHLIGPNGAFLPVIYTKEKIAVRVCGLHFTDVLTVTTSPNGVPENAADIRGAAPVTPPASLSGTLDMLQSGTATGGTTTQPGLGLGAATAIPTLTLSGITPGTLNQEDQTPGKFPTYTPAAVTASGKQVALLLYSLEANAKELTRLIDRTMGKPYAEKMKEANDAGATGNAPGSVNGVKFIVNLILDQVKADGQNNPQNNANSAVFDRHLTDIQNINAQISTLASSLTSQAFASNAIALLNNYAVLAGVLDLANLARDPQYCQPGIVPAPKLGALSADDLKKIDFTNLGNLTLSQVRSLSDEEIKQLSNKEKDASGETLQERVKEIHAALKLVKPTEPSEDKPLCSAFEKQKIQDFWNAYNQQVAFIVHEIHADTETADENLTCVSQGSRAKLKDPYIPDPDDKNPDRFAKFAGCRLYELNEKLNELRKGLREIDLTTTELYDLMNEWYFHSSVEQTDLLPPFTSNAIVRISIVVQRGYTPFTLANAGAAITPTATLNVPATATAASTSTPAHAVKTILVEVHRLANFDLMGGVMFIHIPTTSYALQNEQATPVSPGATTFNETCGATNITVLPNNGEPPTYSCLVQTQHTDWQLAAMAGLLWYPWGRDYFPRRSGYVNSGRDLLPSFLIATSVSSLGNSMGGVNWEPMNGVDFYVGLGSAHRTVLPPGITTNTIMPSGSTLQTQTQEHAGLTLGVGFDLSVIAQIFTSKSTSVATMP